MTKEKPEKEWWPPRQALLDFVSFYSIILIGAVLIYCFGPSEAERTKERFEAGRRYLEEKRIEQTCKVDRDINTCHDYYSVGGLRDIMLFEDSSKIMITGIVSNRTFLTGFDYDKDGIIDEVELFNNPPTQEMFYVRDITRSVEKELRDVRGRGNRDSFLFRKLQEEYERALKPKSNQTRNP